MSLVCVAASVGGKAPIVKKLPSSTTVSSVLTHLCYLLVHDFVSRTLN